MSRLLDICEAAESEYPAHHTMRVFDDTFDTTPTMPDLRELSDAATAAPWEDDGIAVWHGDTFLPDSPADRSLIARLRNDYAAGNLIERERVDALIAALSAELADAAKQLRAKPALKL